MDDRIEEIIESLEGIAAALKWKCDIDEKLVEHVIARDERGEQLRLERLAEVRANDAEYAQRRSKQDAEGDEARRVTLEMVEIMKAMKALWEENAARARDWGEVIASLRTRVEELTAGCKR